MNEAFYIIFLVTGYILGRGISIKDKVSDITDRIGKSRDGEVIKNKQLLSEREKMEERGIDMSALPTNPAKE